MQISNYCQVAYTESFFITMYIGISTITPEHDIVCQCDTEH